MRALTLQSSQIANLAYDPDEETLFIHFQSSGKWAKYDGVPGEVVLSILFDTVSHGRAFDALVKSAEYPWKYVEQGEYGLHV